MKKLLIKKIPAAALTAVLLFVTVLSMSIFANAASSFTPRLEEPEAANEYYYSDKNVFYKYGYGMPNCTAYAYGRAYELLKSEPMLCHYNADEWYDYNKDGGYYSYGSTPKLGAIACWSYSGGGHVAVVEKIENGTITFSNSGWNYLNFYLTTASVTDPNAGQSKWSFQGYIYIGDFENGGSSATDTQATQPADSGCKTGVYQVEVNTTLNMRSGAGTSYSRIASIPNGALLTVTEVKTGEGYTWGYTSYNGNDGWVALDYCNFISELPPDATEPLYGDVNGDGETNVADATALQQYIVEEISLPPETVERCDFNGDGSINVMDATALQMYIVRM